eukprot:GFUD01017014.1.p1 GENE.GFUD01017014.1~~GFUD01017014.1.p1  ORF type:complete len:113 (-),score=44.38 GFUD01017014.1:449-787(-)
MRYVAAAILVSMAGNEVSVASIKKILDSVGVEADKEKIAIVVNSLKGKNINEVIIEGQNRLGSVPSGGAVVAASGAAPVTVAVEPAAVEKKVEKKEEPEEESDDDMGFGLFD